MCQDMRDSAVAGTINFQPRTPRHAPHKPQPRTPVRGLARHMCNLVAATALTSQPRNSTLLRATHPGFVLTMLRGVASPCALIESAL